MCHFGMVPIGRILQIDPIVPCMFREEERLHPIVPNQLASCPRRGSQNFMRHFLKASRDVYGKNAVFKS